jgi:hypothetical protein
LEATVQAPLSVRGTAVANVHVVAELMVKSDVKRIRIYDDPEKATEW